MLTILGLRLIPNIDGGEVNPTPTAAPVERIIGALGAEYLKPINIVTTAVNIVSAPFRMEL